MSSQTQLLLLCLTWALFSSACAGQPEANEQQFLVFARRHGIPFDSFPTYIVGENGKVHKNVPRGLGHLPDWSPDGKWIIFSSIFSERLTQDSEIFLLPAAGGEPILITTGQYGGVSATWSPDGRSIAYQDGGNTGIYILNVECFLQPAGTGSCTPEPRFLTKGQEPDWSPTSDQIVFTLQLEGKVFLVDAGQGGQVQEITPTGEFCHHPRWSPDGTRIVLGCLGRIYILTADGQVEKLFPEEMVQGAYPNWTVDGERILFVSSRDEGLDWALDFEGNIRTGALFSVNLDGTDLKRITLRDDESIFWYAPIPIK